MDNRLIKRKNKFDSSNTASPQHSKQLKLNPWFKHYLLMFLLLFSVISFYTFNRQKESINQLNIGKKLYSNGTSNYKPTLILVSIDGFRPSYIDAKRTPFMHSLLNKSLKTKQFIPSFPTITFPNHYSLVTGLYPDSHGIIANDFFDFKVNKTFKHVSKEILNSYWWLGEPIWATVQKNNDLSAVHMWPGSETLYDQRLYIPHYLTRFKPGVSLQKKLDEIANYLDMDFYERPVFIASYVYEVDSNGHDYGTQAKHTIEWIKKVDDFIEQLFSCIKSRNIDGITNIVLVSDHGMADVKARNLIYLDDYIDLNEIKGVYLYPYAGIVPRNMKDLDKIYQQLMRASKEPRSKFKVYKKEDLPKKYHYGTNHRVPPIICIQKIGWAFVTNQEIKEHGFTARGLHGYDNYHPEMQALFIAHGPAFKAKTLEAFENVNVYNLICHVLKLNASPNNGSIDWKDILS